MGSEKRKLKVLFTLGRLCYGGMEQGVLQLVSNMDVRRFEVSLVTFRGADDSVRSLLPGQVKYTEMTRSPGFDFAFLWFLIKEFRKQRVDIVQSHNWETWLYSYIAAKLSGVRVYIHCEHGRDAERIQEPLRRFLCKRVLSLLADHFVTVSEEISLILQSYLSVPKQKISTIENGIDLERFCNREEMARKAREELELSERAFVVGTVIGTLRPVKDLPMLLRGFALFQIEISESVLVIIGGSSMLKQLRTSALEYEQEMLSLIEKLGISNRVRFTGPVSDVQNYLPVFDVYVNSSIYEGTSYSILEAMATRIPVIATRVGGTPHIVKHDETGFLIPPGDPEALHQALRRVHGLGERRMSVTNAARTQVEKYHNRQEMFRKYEELYERCLSSS